VATPASLLAFVVGQSGNGVLTNVTLDLALHHNVPSVFR
jgi:hypothetical protein